MGERVRFSPSPTGGLHLGGARTALFNRLVAWRDGGTFVLRIEDTDIDRCDPACERSIAEDLAWLGLAPDEGPGPGGPDAPYRQSERGAVYAAALETLVAEGAVYRCFCTAEQLAHQRGRHVEEGTASRYSGACRSLDPAASEERARCGDAHVWRFAVDRSRDVVVHDVVHGDVTFRGDTVSDFVVARSDGSAVYDLACVADDGAMRITTVIRGDDHLPNTARQILLHEALGQTPPRFAHIPLVVGPDASPLSKSEGAMAVGELRAAGYLPEAVVNHLALLGWSDPAHRDVMSLPEITSAFDIARVSSAPAAHDPARLRWLNARHMRRLSPDARLEIVDRFIGEVPASLDRAAVVAALADEVEVAGEAATLAAPLASPLPVDDDASLALSWPLAVGALRAAASALAGATPEPPPGDGLAAAVRSAIKAKGVEMKVGLPALRAALTGRAHGLPIGTLLALLGPRESTARIDAALAAIDRGEGRNE
jgi:nondiscriminating glutamyl-tRNA synthetase